MIYANELRNEGQHRIDQLNQVEHADATRLTRHHLCKALDEAKSAIERDIDVLLKHGTTTGGHHIASYLHNLIPLRQPASRVLPAIAGLRQLGNHSQANALEARWNGWVAAFNGIAARCPKKLPSGKRARKNLTDELGTEVLHLLRQIALDLECE